MTPGDILITLRTCGDLRRGDVVTVSHTSPSGEYVYLDEQDGKISSRADAFMVAVRRPWHAWADPEWERRAREAAERFVREGIAVEATDPDVLRTALVRCVAEFEHRDWGRRTDGNAPGHAHSRPGIWDDDNGAKAGTRCEWCAAWPKIRALAEKETSR
jgi:hypothetical protein